MAFLRDDEAGLDLPAPWRKLLVLSNLEDDELQSLAFNWRMSEDEYFELRKWSAHIGSFFDFSLIPDTEEESAKFGQVIDISDGIRARLRRERWLAAVACIALLASIGFGRYRELRSTEQVALLNEQMQRLDDERKQAESRAEVANMERDSVKQNAATSNRALAAAVKESKERESLVSSKNKKLLQLIATAKPINQDPGISLPHDHSEVIASAREDATGREPSLTAIRNGNLTYRWSLPKQSRNQPVKVQLFNAGAKHSFWESPEVDGVEASIENNAKLLPGHPYQWALVDHRGHTLLPRTMFYVLTLKESNRLQRALERVSDQSQRAAIYVRFKLFDELAHWQNPALRK